MGHCLRCCHHDISQLNKFAQHPSVEDNSEPMSSTKLQHPLRTFCFKSVLYSLTYLFVCLLVRLLTYLQVISRVHPVHPMNVETCKGDLIEIRSTDLKDAVEELESAWSGCRTARSQCTDVDSLLIEAVRQTEPVVIVVVTDTAAIGTAG